MMKLNVVSIIKDEGPYLVEWLEWNIAQGVDKFLIYDNESTDDTHTILDRYKSIGYVDWKTWPRLEKHISTQLVMHRDFLNRNPKLEEWCFFIDADEFPFFRGERTVKEWLSRKPYLLAGVGVPWMLYGSSGHENYEPGFVIDRFTRRSEMLDKHIKCVVVPAHIESPGNDAHSFRAKKGYGFVDVWNQKIPDFTATFTSRPLTTGIIRINHYHTKSRLEYKKRCERGRIDIWRSRDFETDFSIHNINEVQDLEPLSYLPKMRENLRSRPWNLKLVGNS